MKSLAIFLSFLLLILASNSLAASEKEMMTLTPLDNEVTGWELEETYFAGDAESLMARINGGGPFYVDRGSKEVLFQEYYKGSQYVSLEVYRMADKASAKKLYADINAIRPEPLKDLGDEARFDGSLIGSYLVEFRNREFFVRLMISQKSTLSKKVIFKFAKAVSGKIDAVE